MIKIKKMIVTETTALSLVLKLWDATASSALGYWSKCVYFFILQESRKIALTRPLI